jgi:hypothetical protein
MTIAATRPLISKATVAKPLPLVGRTELELAGGKLAEAEQLTAERAALAILDRYQPNKQAATELIRVGLASGIQAILDELRHEQAAANPDRERSARQAAVAPSRVLGDPLTLTLVGADGIRRSLLHFTLADWQFIAADRGSRAATALKQKQVAERAIELLVRDGKATVAELAAPARDSLKLIAKAAWS